MNKYYPMFARLLDSAVRNISNAFYDQYVEVNTKFRARAGLKQVVIRRQLWKCCDWCAKLAGVYPYGTEPKMVWRRHQNCRCMVTTKTEKGTYQDAWSRKEYDRQKTARIAREKEIISEFNSRQARRLETNSRLGFYDGLKREDIVNRVKIGKRNPDNLGIIADKILNGEFPLSMINDKYFQHRLGTEQYQKVTIGRGRPQSYLIISKDEAQQLIYKYAGTGIIDKKKQSREYIDCNKTIGYYHKNGVPIKTSKMMIIYSKIGAHIVPVQP